MIDINLDGKRCMILDFEATSKYAEYAHIIQASILEYSDNVSEWRLHNWFYTPVIQIPREVTDLTGLNMDICRKYSEGLTFEENANGLINTLSQCDILAGHNIKRFDMDVLKNNLRRVGLTPMVNSFELYDTMEDRAKILGLPPKKPGRMISLTKMLTAVYGSEAWQTTAANVCKALGAEGDSVALHNAQYDVVSHALLIRGMRRKFGMIK